MLSWINDVGSHQGRPAARVELVWTRPVHGVAGLAGPAASADVVFGAGGAAQFPVGEERRLQRVIAGRIFGGSIVVELQAELGLVQREGCRVHHLQQTCVRTRHACARTCVRARAAVELQAQLGLVQGQAWHAHPSEWARAYTCI